MIYLNTVVSSKWTPLDNVWKFFASQMMALNEEEALKIILGTPVHETPISAKLRAEESNAEKNDDHTKSLSENQVNPESVEDSNPKLVCA